MKESIAKIILGMILAIHFVGTAYATGTKGGGNAIVCFDPDKASEILKEYEHNDIGGNPIPAQLNDQGQLRNIRIRDEHLGDIESVESFDLYEARLSANRKSSSIIDLKENEKPTEYIERLLAPFDVVLPSFVNRIRNAMLRIPLEDARFYPFGVLPENDFTTVGMIDLSRCVLSSIFVQEKIKDVDYLHVDDRLFNHSKHSALSRAVGYLHEIVYLVMRDGGDETSDAARKIVSEIITRKEGQSYEEFIKKMTGMGFLGVYDSAVDTQSRLIDLALQLDLHLRDLMLSNLQIKLEDFFSTVNQVAETEGDFYVFAENGNAGAKIYSEDPVWIKAGDLLHAGNPSLAFQAVTDGSYYQRFFFAGSYKPYVERAVGRRKKIENVPLKDESIEAMEAAWHRVVGIFKIDQYETEMEKFYDSQIYPIVMNMVGFDEGEKKFVDQYFRIERAYSWDSNPAKYRFAPRTKILYDKYLYDTYRPIQSGEYLRDGEIRLSPSIELENLKLKEVIEYPN